MLTESVIKWMRLTYCCSSRNEANLVLLFRACIILFVVIIFKLSLSLGILRNMLFPYSVTNIFSPFLRTSKFHLIL